MRELKDYVMSLSYFPDEKLQKDQVWTAGIITPVNLGFFRAALSKRTFLQ